MTDPIAPDALREDVEAEVAALTLDGSGRFDATWNEALHALTPRVLAVVAKHRDEWADELVECPCENGHVVFIDDGDGGVFRCPVCALADRDAEVERLRAEVELLSGNVTILNRAEIAAQDRIARALARLDEKPYSPFALRAILEGNG